jgi:hypothetical protein
MSQSDEIARRKHPCFSGALGGLPKGSRNRGFSPNEVSSRFVKQGFSGIISVFIGCSSAVEIRHKDSQQVFVCLCLG